MGACLRSGRKREDIRLMAVTKFQTPETIDEAWKAGLRCFGESRVQEAAAKFAACRERYPGMELHLIGSLQRNKAKRAASLFDCIQSVDREALVTELAKARSGLPLPLLLEFRTGEDTKSGFTDTGELFRVVEMIQECPSLCVTGLMTIAPDTRDEGRLRSAFRKLVTVQQELERRFPVRENGSYCLSMGMSGDFEIAVEEGSTLLRIGGALFSGERI